MGVYMMTGKLSPFLSCHCNPENMIRPIEYRHPNRAAFFQPNHGLIEKMGQRLRVRNGPLDPNDARSRAYKETCIIIREAEPTKQGYEGESKPLDRVTQVDSGNKSRLLRDVRSCGA